MSLNTTPIIGIPINTQVYMSAGDSKQTYFLNDEYAKILTALGAMPILLPYTDNLFLIRQQVGMCDGIMLAGGDDVAPYLYGEEPENNLGSYNADIDHYHMNIGKEALMLDKPILGICRGCQLINILHGGNLYMDISAYDQKHLLHSQTGRRKDLCHTVIFQEGSKLHNNFGDQILTNSFHHQAIDKVGHNLIVTGNSKDGIVEGIESETLTYCVGVQWHPEIMAMHSTCMNPLFIDFIEHCKENKQQ